MKNPAILPIKVDIFNTKYSIKPTESLTEDDIRTLASYVDQMMRQMCAKGYDKVSGAILVALNLAEQVHKNQSQYIASIRRLIQIMDEGITEEGAEEVTRVS